jgi:RNA recognition motif-containing protein
VTFKKNSAAKAALEKMQGKEIQGRTLHVDFDSHKAKGSYK